MGEVQDKLWNYKKFFKSKRTRAVLFLLFLLGFFSWHSKHIFVKFYHSPTVHQHVKFALPTKYATNIKEPQHIETHFIKNPTTLLFHHMKNDLVIFFVKSAPENIARRMMIRKTWGSVKYINGKQLFVVFLIGTPVNQSQHHLLDDEKQCFDDILQSTQPDTYANLTLKILGAFRWIINHLNSIRTFYIFTNDNCVINISKTIAFLRKIKERQAMYCGFQYEKQSGVIRGEGKWGVNWLQYSATEYPDFCRGVMVILTPALVAQIYKVAQHTKFQEFPLEDVMVYGILRYKIYNDSRNIYPVINGGHPLVFYPWDNSKAVVGKMEKKWLEWRMELRHFVLKKEQSLSKQCRLLYSSH